MIRHRGMPFGGYRSGGARGSLRALAALLIFCCALSLASARAAPAGPEADLGEKGEARAADTSLIEKSARPQAEQGANKPALEYEQFRQKIETQVAGKRQEQIETLKKIIALGGDPKELPGLIFRLAELYWEESKAEFFQANAQDDRIIAAREKEDEAAVAAATKQKAALLQKSADLKKEAVALYNRIIKEFPKYERTDEVLYFLGLALKEDGKTKESLAAFKVLIQRFPESNFAPDAYLAFGEHYFDSGDLKKALKAYEKAAEKTDSKVYGFALYKQAWCHYNLQNYARALDLFRSVIFYGEIASQVSGENKLALVKEARKDYVLTFSHFGEASAAKADFEKVGGPEHGRTMLSGLAGLYYSTGRDLDAIAVYRQLVADQPLGSEAPLYQSRIVDCASRIGDKRQTVRETRLLLKVFQDVKAAGAGRTEKDKASFEEAKRLAERTLRSLAVQYHNEWKKTRDDETVRLARELYDQYLRVFPDTKYAYDMRFYFGELLYKLDEFDRAAEAYTHVVREDEARIEKKEKPGRWLHDAAYAAVLSWDEVVQKARATEKLPPGKEKRAIPPVEQGLLEACQRFLRLVPKAEKRVEIGYKAAQIYYRYNHFEEAVSRFSKIALEHPEHELAEYSANLVLDSFNLQEDWARLNEWARMFLGEVRLAKGKLKEDLSKIVVQSSFKVIEAVEKTGELEKAADAFVAFSREFKTDDLADVALWNASIDYVKARRLDKAIAAREELAKSFPESPHVPSAVFANGADYEAVARFAEAAEAYERYVAGFMKARAEKSKKPPSAPAKGEKKEKPPQTWEEDKAQVALFNAAIFREGLKDARAAIKHRLTYLALWPDAKEAEAIALTIADLHEREGDYAKAVEATEAWIKRYGKGDPDKQLAAMHRLVKLFKKAKNDRMARATYAQIWDTWSRLGPKARERVDAGLEAVAEAHYLDGEETWEKYVKVPFLLRAVDKSLAEKITRLKQVEARYGETIGLKAGGPAICALARIASAYRHFAQWLNDAPAPSEFNEEQKEMFRAQLREQALPVEEKAVDGYTTALRKARELDLFNACAEAALKALMEMRPDQYPERLELTVALPSFEAPPAQAGLLLALQPIPPRPQAARRAAAPAAPAPAPTAPVSPPTPAPKAAPAPLPAKSKPARGMKSLDADEPGEPEDDVP